MCKNKGIIDFETLFNFFVELLTHFGGGGGSLLSRLPRFVLRFLALAFSKFRVPLGSSAFILSNCSVCCCFDCSEPATSESIRLLCYSFCEEFYMNEVKSKATGAGVTFSGSGLFYCEATAGDF